MAKLNMPNISKWTPDTVGKFVSSARIAIENHDYDPGWMPNPNTAGTASVKHRLVVQPKTVLVYASSNADGSGCAQILPSYVDNQTIQFSTASPFVRILANK